MFRAKADFADRVTSQFVCETKEQMNFDLSFKEGQSREKVSRNPIVSFSFHVSLQIRIKVSTSLVKNKQINFS